jgi:predicted amidohydrolase
MRIAAIQADLTWEDPGANHRRLAPRVAAAADDGARLVVLPEMFATGFSMHTDRIAEPPDGPSTEFLRDCAQRHGVHVAGSIAVLPPGAERPRNRLTVAHPDGGISHYDKIHPFSYGREHEHYDAGDELVTITIDDVRCSLFVCYDLRFADEFWALADATDCYVVVANWPASRRHHWRSLLVARAIENQAYVVGCNRVGTAPGLEYEGDTMIVDPLGAITAEAGPGEGSAIAEVDPAVVASIRAEFPFLPDRR